MKVLVIADINLVFDVKSISNTLNEEVTLNSVSEDGVSFFQCGKVIPDLDWDWVVRIGVCNQDLPEGLTVNVEIPLEGDPLGTFMSDLMTVKEGQLEESAISELS